MQSMFIRDYDPARDAQALRRALIELQEAERALDPYLPPGDEMADRYLAKLFTDCDEHDGRILVLEVSESGAFAGYAALLRHVPSTEPDDDPTPYAYLSDFLIVSSFRGLGAGRTLLQAVEKAAKDSGARRLRLSVLAANAPARRLYEAAGFTDHVVEMETRFD